jgi:glyceraldehyde 3-phosphate dehydrogenase
VLEQMRGRLDAPSLRVPVIDGSITDFTAVVNRQVTVEDVDDAFRAAAEAGPLSKVVAHSEAPIVSSDIVGSPASCIFDAGLKVLVPLDGTSTLVKVFGWYDNQWGYTSRLIDLAVLVGQASGAAAAA